MFHTAHTSHTHTFTISIIHLHNLIFKLFDAGYILLARGAVDKLVGHVLELLLQLRVAFTHERLRLRELLMQTGVCAYM